VVCHAGPALSALHSPPPPPLFPYTTLFRSFPAGEFDLAISRFGTMFFADPVAAFGNVARALRPGGRLVMLVWQAREHNEWAVARSEEHTSELQSRFDLVCRLLLEKKKQDRS